MEHFGQPEIFNTDQGCQFTDERFVQCVLERNIKLSMDGRGRAIDNVFVERLWRSLKYEDVYLRMYETIGEARKGIGDYLRFLNEERPHSALDSQPPALFYDTLRRVA